MSRFYTILRRRWSLRISDQRTLPSLLFDPSSLLLLLLLPGYKPSSSLWGAFSVASYLALRFNIAHSQSIYYNASDFFLKRKYYPIMLPITYEIKSVLCPWHTKILWCEPGDPWQQCFLIPFQPKFWNPKVICLLVGSMSPFCLDVFATVVLDWSPFSHLESPLILQ